MTIRHFKAKALPRKPGVYLFKDKKGGILYIGRATNLRERVRSYFAPDLIATRGPLLVDMVTKARGIRTQTTDSVLEAIILEANLIRKRQPYYNTKEKDDKSFNYVMFTEEEYPRILVMRGKDLANRDRKEFKAVYGPFPHGLLFKDALKLIRKLFPFRDTCVPNSGKRCFNAQIGLCPGVCSGEMGSAAYRQRVRNLELFFQGKKKKLLAELKRQMRVAIKAEEFEKADVLKRQIFGLTHIQDVSLIRNEYRAPLGGLFRIEAYDIAHLGGTSTVGVFTVVENGEPNRAQYRMFRIRQSTQGSDTAALSEVLSRRLGHPEWGYPRLIVVDGGIAQKNVAERVLRGVGIEIPVVGVVKDDRHRPRRIIGEKKYTEGYGKAILLANAEAHRFAISYHRRRRALLPGSRRR